MGKSVTVKTGFSQVYLDDGRWHKPGDVVILSDAEYTRLLTTGTARAVTLTTSGLPDPSRTNPAARPRNFEIPAAKLPNVSGFALNVYTLQSSAAAVFDLGRFASPTAVTFRAILLQTAAGTVQVNASLATYPGGTLVTGSEIIGTGVQNTAQVMESGNLLPIMTTNYNASVRAYQLSLLVAATGAFTILDPTIVVKY